MAYATSIELSEELLDLARSKVDELTFNWISDLGYENLTTFQKAKIEKATLLQAQYYEDYGTDFSSVSSFNVAGLSMTMDQKSEVPAGVSPSAYMLLKQSGLMYRGFLAWWDYQSSLSIYLTRNGQ